MIDFNFDQNCYGCAACASVCPTHAISMKPDQKGFAMPEINLDDCVGCSACERVCPHLNLYLQGTSLKEAVCKAAYRISEDRMQSSSGGIVAVITERILTGGGITIACGWTEDLVAKHMQASTLEEAENFKTSKYVQSDMQEAYSLTKNALSEGKKVLFVGLPCQIGAMRNFFGNPENLYLIGLICGGVPSPKVWAEFKKDAEKKHRSRMVSVNMRSKGRYGWNTPVALYEFENGEKSEKLSFQLDDYVLQYLHGLFKRSSCYNCQYKGDQICADLICGDYWGSPEFRDKSENKGVSAVLSLTDKGNECLDMLYSECEIIDTDLDAVLKKNQPLIAPGGYSGDREEFFVELDKSGYSKSAKLYGGKTNPIKHYGMSFLDKTGLFEKVKRYVKG